MSVLGPDCKDAGLQLFAVLHLHLKVHCSLYMYILQGWLKAPRRGIEFQPLAHIWGFQPDLYQLVAVLF